MMPLRTVSEIVYSHSITIYYDINSLVNLAQITHQQKKLMS